MIIYLIEASGGQYDDTWSQILSAFSSRELAQAEIDRIVTLRKEREKLKFIPDNRTLPIWERNKIWDHNSIINRAKELWQLEIIEFNIDEQTNSYFI